MMLPSLPSRTRRVWLASFARTFNQHALLTRSSEGRESIMSRLTGEIDVGNEQTVSDCGGGVHDLRVVRAIQSTEMISNQS